MKKKIRKFISKGLIISTLFFNIPIGSLAGTLSDDTRYETFEGSNIAINNILEKDKFDVEIKGDTLINLWDYKNLTNGYFVSESSNRFENFFTTNVEMIKPNTQYTLIAEVVENKLNNTSHIRLINNDLGDSCFNIIYSIQGGQTGIFKKVLTSNTDLSSAITVCRSYIFNDSGTSAKVKVRCILLEGDWTNREIPKYFEGIKSVGQTDEGNNQIDISLSNKNLWNIEAVRKQNGEKPSYTKNGDTITYTQVGEYGVYVPIEVKKGQTLRISGKVKNVHNIRIFKESDNFAGMGVYNVYYEGRESDIAPNYVYTFTEDGVYHIRVWCQNIGTAILTNFLAEISDANTSYVEHEERKSSIVLKEPLRGLPNGVKDKIIKKDGKWYIERRCEKVILDGSESWVNANASPTNIFETPVPEMVAYSHLGQVLCDKFPTHYTNLEVWNTYNGIVNLEQRRVLCIRNSATKTISDLKLWLKQNPLEVVYQLEKPKYELLQVNPVMELYLETTYILNNSTIPANIKIIVDRVANRAKEFAEIAKKSPSVENIALARMWANLMKDSVLKDSIQDSINDIVQIDDLEIEKKTVSANVDLYIESENTLSMSLSTNSIVFEDFTGTDELEMMNAVDVIVSSSLPYDLNVYMPNGIYNADKSNSMDINVLKIKASEQTQYKSFANNSDKIVLKENCEDNDNAIHSIDLKLSGGNTYKADVYKTVLKFEAEQR